MVNKDYQNKPKSKLAVIFKNCSLVCVLLCTTVVRNTAQKSSDNFPYYRPDNHHSSDDVYWMGRAMVKSDQFKIYDRQYSRSSKTANFASS